MMDDVLAVALEVERELRQVEKALEGAKGEFKSDVGEVQVREELGRGHSRSIPQLIEVARTAKPRIKASNSRSIAQAARRLVAGPKMPRRELADDVMRGA